MSEGSESAATRESARKLSDAIRDVKNAAADRADVVVDLRDAERMRLELIAGELKPVFEDVPVDSDLFDFAISSGLQPRLWIDAVSYVAMGRDKRTYRFVRDTRAGRVVLAESADMTPVAEQVTRYVAERLVERQRLLDGAPESVLPVRTADGAATDPAGSRDRSRARLASLLGGLYLVSSGVLLAVFAALVFLLWNRFDELFAGLPL
ncbi:MAG: hypothetical protein IT533_05310 [Hyphomicrobiales bacterium]|jgi:hypothetical protein|nr:hypothetical protein [Hyphomicrobiales bacterium]